MRARSAASQFSTPSPGLARSADGPGWHGSGDDSAPSGSGTLGGKRTPGGLDAPPGACAVPDAASTRLAEQANHSAAAFGLKRVGAAVRAAVATTWAATLLLTGLWVAMNGPERWPVLRELCLMGGSALLAGGQFLFLVLVADRAFPRASSRLVWGAEVLLFAAFVVGLGAALYMLAVGVGGLGLPAIAVGEAH